MATTYLMLSEKYVYLILPPRENATGHIGFQLTSRD
jgi:hypothetical protein